MKKFLTLILSLVLLITALTSFGCKTKDDGNIQLYVPDGAPALSVARLLHDDNALSSVDVNVVQANLIQTYVTGKNSKADFCILPVNASVKMLGNAKNYQMLGVVTHGNLFLMKKQNGQDITKTNLSDLIGKKVGVINISNVPGLTFKAILNDASIPFVQNQGDGLIDANKVNLFPLTSGVEATPSANYDYFVLAEPAVTTKQNATGGKLSVASSLQDLYGNGQGYPQAVLVAKKSVINKRPELVAQLISSFSANQAWLTAQDTTTSDIVNAVKKGFVDKETSATFTAENLNATVITNCAINFESAITQKQAVLDYMAKINAITSNAFGTPVEDFFFVSK